MPSDPVAFLRRLIDGLHDAADGGDLAAWQGAIVSLARVDDPDLRLAGHLATGAVLRAARAGRRHGMLALPLAAALVAELERDRHEPALWSLLAEVLTGLGHGDAADRCVSAARVLEPESPAPPAGAAELYAPASRVAQRAVALAADVRWPDRPQRLTAAMIVRDEEAMLPECLESVRGVVDEIVVVDTGSTDRTAEIARSHGATVVDFEWVDDFAAARNVSLEHTTGDWVLWLDADERLHPEDHDALRRVIAKPWRRAANIVQINHTHVEGAGAEVASSSIKLWRHAPGHRFEGRIHEQVAGLPRWLPERFEHPPVRLLHHGFREERFASKGKFERNRQLLERLVAEGDGERLPYDLYSLGVEHLVHGDAADALPLLERSLAELERRGALAIQPWAPMLLVRLTIARRRTGDPAGAERAAAAWLELFPDHTDLAVERAECAAAVDPDRGLELLDAAIAMGDGPARYASIVGMGTYVGCALRGDFLAHAGRHAEAVESYRRGLGHNPSYLASIGGLARSLLAGGVPAADVLDELAPLVRPFVATVGSLLASAFLLAGATDEAGAVYGEMLAAAPDSAEARTGVASCLIARGELAAAAELCEPLPAAEEAVPLLRCALLCALAQNDAGAVARLLADAAFDAMAEAEGELFRAWAAVGAGRPHEPLSSAAARAGLGLFTTVVRIEALGAVDALHRLLAGSALGVAAARDAMAQRLFEAGFVDVAADEWLAVLEDEASAPALFGLARVAAARGERDDAVALAAEACRLEPTLEAHAGEIEQLVAEALAA